jgi:hypothetical protein
MQDRLLIIGTVLFVALGVRAADANHEERATGDPKGLGRVVIVPFLDLSGEQHEAKEQYRETALGEVEKRFRKYDIAYVPREETQAALTALKLDSTDEEDRTRASMKTIADYLRARYVVTGTIHDANSGWRQRGFLGGQTKAGQAKVQFRVFDATMGRFAEALEGTVTATARAKAFSSGAFSRASKLRMKAVKDATKKAMLPFLKPYPKVHDEDPAEEKEEVHEPITAGTPTSAAAAGG